jgi:HD superfamily phosphohydrolase YqeK
MENRYAGDAPKSFPTRNTYDMNELLLHQRLGNIHIKHIYTIKDSSTLVGITSNSG